MGLGAAPIATGESDLNANVGVLSDVVAPGPWVIVVSGAGSQLIGVYESVRVTLVPLPPLATVPLKAVIAAVDVPSVQTVEFLNTGLVRVRLN